MKEIDWSKAPEGATHFMPENEENRAAWYKKNDGIWLFSLDRNDSWDEAFDNEFYILKNSVENPRSWTGEGLPPVGAECEHQGTADSMDWMAVKIIAHTMAHGRDVAVFQYGDTVSFSSAQYFRPIRTPEQIAAEEREEAIDDIAEIIGSLWSSEREAAEFLYKAGYRKTEAKQ